jgi:hypothetical protein
MSVFTVDHQPASLGFVPSDRYRRSPRTGATMPESRKRKRPVATAHAATATPKRRPPSPPWVGYTIAALFAIGLVYLLFYYLSNGALPIKSINGWNIFVGFGFIVGGFGMLTQWR